MWCSRGRGGVGEGAEHGLDGVQGEYVVHGAGLQGGLGHAGVLGGVRVLDHHGAAAVLDGLGALCAVTARTAEHEDPGPLPIVLGERGEQPVRRGPDPVDARRVGQPQCAVRLDEQMAVGGAR